MLVSEELRLVLIAFETHGVSLTLEGVSYIELSKKRHLEHQGSVFNAVVAVILPPLSVFSALVRVPASCGNSRALPALDCGSQQPLQSS